MSALPKGVRFDPAVPVGETHRRPSNHNSWDPAKFAAFKSAIVAGGFTSVVLLRELPGGGLEVVDGEHRCAAAEAVGLDYVPALVYELGACPDDLATAKHIAHNALRGSTDLAVVAQQLLDAGSLSGLEAVAGYTAVEIQSLVGCLEPVDVNVLELADDIAPSAPDPAEILGSAPPAKASAASSKPVRHELVLKLSYETAEELAEWREHFTQLDPDKADPSAGLAALVAELW